MKRFAFILSVLLLVFILAQLAMSDDSTSDVAVAPGIRDLGQPVYGASDIWDLATWRDGAGYKVFGGTSRQYHLFLHDPSTGVSRDLGAPGFEWYSIQDGGNGFMYGGGYRGGPTPATEVSAEALRRNAHFGIYNPRAPWRPGYNPRDMGPAVLLNSGNLPRHPAVIFDLARSTNGLICGGTGYAYDINRYDYAYVFAYNPRMRWRPGINPRATQIPLRSQQGVTRLTAGRNGMMYGLSMSSSRFHLFAYDPRDNEVSLIMEFPTAADGNLGAVTTGPDGKIYIGIGKDIYAYYPQNSLKDGAKSDGQIPARGDIWRMVTSPDGRLYCGTDQGEFIVYDPEKPWKPGYKPGNNPRNLGRAIYGESKVRALAAGTDGMVYGGTASHAHLFEFVPVIDLGQPVARATDIWDLTTRRDHKVYGGTGSVQNLFFYEPDADEFKDLGRPGFEWYSVQAGRNDLIYGGGYRGALLPTIDNSAEAVVRNAHFGIYNPVKPWKPGINPRDMGPAVLIGGSIPPPPAVIFDLAESTNGLICGGTGYARDVGRYDYAYVFAYNPYLPWKPGANPCSKEIPMPNQQGVSRVTAGRDGKIYGLSISSSRFNFFVYDPRLNRVNIIMELPAGPDGNPGALTTGADGRIFIGIDREIYAYYPGTLLDGGVKSDGQAPGKGSIWRMTTGRDGKIYIGTDRGEFAVYNPNMPWEPGYKLGKNPRCLGQAVRGEWRIDSLTAGMDGKIYGGTGLHAHLFEYIPVMNAVLDLTVEAGDVNYAASDDEALAITNNAQTAGKAPIQLLNCFPSPCNPETWIPYRITEDVNDVTISIYSVSGQLVRILHVGNRMPGLYNTKDTAAYWDGMNESGEAIGSGIYFYQVKAGEFTATRKMVVAK